MKAFCYIFTLSLLNIPIFSASFSEAPLEPWGKDSGLAHRIESPHKTLPQSLGQKTCRTLIRFFQNTISPIDGPRSSFYPTSSQYTLEAIQKHGVFTGISMGCDRLMRENGEMWVYDTTDNYGITRKIDPVK